MPGSNATSPEQSSEPSSGPERRRSARFSPPRVLRCQVVPAAAGPAPGATLLDVSEHGAALLVSRKLPAKSKFTLQLAKGHGHPFCVLSTRVVYCLDADNGRWVLGCEFDTPLTADALADLLS